MCSWRSARMLLSSHSSIAPPATSDSTWRATPNTCAHMRSAHISTVNVADVSRVAQLKSAAATANACSLRRPPRQDIIALRDVSLDACCERKEPEVEIEGRRIADPVKICIGVCREGAEGKDNASHEGLNGIPSPLIALRISMQNLKP